MTEPTNSSSTSEELKPCPFCGDKSQSRWRTYGVDLSSGNSRLSMSCVCKASLEIPSDLELERVWNNAYCWKETERLSGEIQKLTEQLEERDAELGKLDAAIIVLGSQNIEKDQLIREQQASIKTLVEAGNGMDQLLKRLMQGEPITPGMYRLVAIASIKFHQAQQFLKTEGTIE